MHSAATAADTFTHSDMHMYIPSWICVDPSFPIVFSYRGSNGLGKGALPPKAFRASLALSFSCAQAAGKVRFTSLPSM